MTERWTYGRFRRYRSAPVSPWARLADFAVALTILAVAVFFILRLHKLDVEKVVGIPILVDGDSLRVGGERIRLKGIDAPEYRQTCRKAGEDYPCGHLASQALQKMIGGKEISCKGSDRDRYGRLLAVCRVNDENLNLRMVRAGWAVAYGDYRHEEREARQEKLGLWAGTFEEPRQWRRDHRTAEDERKAPINFLSWLREFFRMK
jgi:endonuclease YncB( thermonuclease family)